jgi:hypothetical protein
MRYGRAHKQPLRSGTSVTFDHPIIMAGLDPAILFERGAATQASARFLTIKPGHGGEYGAAP